MAQVHVELVSVDREVWSGDADMVIARTTEGELGVLPGHAPLLGELVNGTVRIVGAEAQEVVAAVHGGFLSVTDEGVRILAEVAELGRDIDPGRARAALDRARSADPGDPEAAAARRRAETRLRAAGQPA